MKRNEIYDKFYNSILKSNKLFESSTRGHSGVEYDVDDGIVSFFALADDYKRITKLRAEQLGFEILNYLITKDEFTIKKLDSRYAYDFTEDGSFFDDEEPEKYKLSSKIPQTTYFARGAEGTGTMHGTVYQELKNTEAYKKWLHRIKQTASIIGWKFIDWLGSEESLEVNRTKHLKTK